MDELVRGGAQGEAELIDCVGPEFPAADETVDSASSPHFVRPGGQLIHGISVVFRTADAAVRAAEVLRRTAFGRCLGESVIADLIASPDDVEPLGADALPTKWGQRLSFTGASAAGVLPIHLDLVVLETVDAVSLLFFADTPDPFPDEERTHVMECIRRRVHDR